MSAGGYFFAFFLAFILASVVSLLVLLAVYQTMKHRTPQVPTLDLQLFAYCPLVTSPPAYAESILPIPPAGTYSQETADALLELSLLISNAACTNQAMPVLPEFPTQTILTDGTTIYGIIYRNATKAVAVFAGLSEWLPSLDNTLTTVSNIGGPSLNAQVNASIYNAYKTYCQSQLIYNLERITDFLVTGHSIGGAFSTLCAADIFARPAYAPNSKTHYSFASPRVGDGNFATYYNTYAKGMRVNNTEDIIPQLPLTNTPYVHVGVDVPFTYSYGNYPQNHVDAYVNFMPGCPLDVGQCQ